MLSFKTPISLPFWVSLFFLRCSKLIFIAIRPSVYPFLRLGIFPAVEHRRLFDYLSPQNINCIFDVGANKGQFAAVALVLSGASHIYCFDPLPSSAKFLNKLQSHCRQTITFFQIALSDVTGFADLHIATAADSSSLLPLSSLQQRIFGVVDTGSKISVDTQTLDDINLPIPTHSLLKIDVQGCELMVLRGASATLSKFDYIYVESSCVELYSNQPLFDELNMFLGANGFGLARVFNECVVPSVGLVQADYLYKNLSIN